MTRRGVPADYYPPDLEHVPTAHELVREGLATVETGKGDPKVVRIKPEGYDLINQAMTRNAERMRRWMEIHSTPATTRELAHLS
jgi:hypothetical protein